MTLRISPCTAEELETLLNQEPTPRAARDHRERFVLQQAGSAVYLLAWRGDRKVGRATLLLQSKYAEVREAHPGTTEINALDADPQGVGTGTALIKAAEAESARLGHGSIGLAVEPGQSPARRLYDRLGYGQWNGGQVTDEWDELQDDGTEFHHADPCDYLIKNLAPAESATE